MSENTITYFPTHSKPTLEDIETYLSTRTGDTDAGLQVHTDQLGNRVFTSLGKKEATLDGEVNSMLVASPQGSELDRQNKGLLHRIANPDSEFQKIGGNTESNVYKVALNLDGQIRHFAVKYYYPIERVTDNIFTPGVDQMRLMQLAEKEKPLDGLKYATPILASIDMTVSPYVEDALESSVIINMLNNNVQVDNSDQSGKISDFSKDVILQIQQYDAKQTDFSKKIIPLLKSQLDNVPVGLSDWLENVAIPSNMISNTFSFTESENLSNFLVSIPEMWKFFQDYTNGAKQDQIDTRDQQQILDRVRSFCYLIEITAVNKPKPKTQSGI